MASKKEQINRSEVLRLQAERISASNEVRSKITLPPEGVQRVLHELQVHQIELELQNEELRRAQTELAASQEQYFNLYDLAPIGYLTQNEQGQILKCNLTSSTLLGVDRNSLVDHPLSRFILREDQDIYYQHHRRLFSTKTPQVCELRLLKQGSDPFWARLESTVIQDPGGVLLCLVMISNITESKKTEKELARLNKILVEKNTELEEVLFAASHDLRSPMVNIIGFTQAIERSCKELVSAVEQIDPSEDLRGTIEPLLKERIIQPIQFIHSGSAKMEALINGLLRVSRLGRTPLKFESLDMNHMLSTIVQVVKYVTNATECEITVEPLPKCLGDADQINQVFSNLLDNAIKYRETSRPLKIRVSGYVHEQESIYCVEDTGIGIPQNRLETIWKMFYRIAERSDVPGEGLGLALIRRIVERHSGGVWVESEVGKGSRFFVALPKG